MAVRAFLDEATREQAVLDLFRGLGHQTAYGPAIDPHGEKPERATCAHVILLDRLVAALEKSNPSRPGSGCSTTGGTWWVIADEAHRSQHGPERG
jgi:hypothetical protein